jgi:subtilisin family serine protease
VPRPRLPIGLALFALLLLAPGALGADRETQPLGAAAPTTAPTFSPSRIIVEWASGTSRGDRIAARQGADVTSMRQLGDPLFQLLAIDPGQSAGDALDALRGDPAVQVASRDGSNSLYSVPNDPLFGELWGLSNTSAGINGFSGAIAGADVNAPLAWDRTTGSPSTVIADIDSGYRFDSPDLGPVAWTNPGEIAGNSVDDDSNGFVDDVHGYDFVGSSADSPTSDNDPTDDNLISGGHGVHTAGTMGAAGNNEVGITGVAQNVRIMPLRVCANSAASEDETRCPFSSQIAAINYAGEMGARVANMSLGGTSFNTAERDAIAANPQTLFVISAGNDSADNDSEPHYPCNYDPLAEGKSAVDNVICVAATDQADQLASFSDWGAGSVDLAAPGTQTLSTFPSLTTTVIDDFETNDFSAKWETTAGAGMGRAAIGDGPLTSFGMNDSPGIAPAPSSIHQSTLTSGIPIPAGSGACTLSGLRFRRADSGSSFSYSILSDGVPVFTNTASSNTSGSHMAAFNTVPITGLGGHSVKLRFGYNAGPSPTAESGIWLDDIKLTCYAPLSTPPGFAFLQGTSMAAPHVTGAAGLLFSLQPGATVAEVREALVDGVDAVPSLAGETVTGGRLDIAKAMESLEGTAVDHTAPQKPILSGTLPESGSNENHPRIVGSAEAGDTVNIFESFECVGTPIATGTAAQLGGAGIEISVPDNSITFLSASATDAARNRSSCSAASSYLEDTPPEPEGPAGGFEEAQKKIEQANPPAPAQPAPAPVCKVPRLTGKTLGQATAALKTAHCTPGTVNKPRAKKGHKLGPLVVKSTNPAPGSLSSSGKVDITLGPKPKPKKHHH